MKIFLALMIFCCFLNFSLPTLAEQCGWQAGGKTCPNRQCCSKWGWCGNKQPYCEDGCQSNCEDFLSKIISTDIGKLISKQTFQRMMLFHCNAAAAATGIGSRPFTYQAFVKAAKSFPSFGNVGSTETRKREIAAFLTHTLRSITGDDLGSEKEAVSYFKKAIWFWMTPQSSLPSYHQLVTNQWNSTLLYIQAA